MGTTDSSGSRVGNGVAALGSGALLYLLLLGSRLLSETIKKLYCYNDSRYLCSDTNKFIEYEGSLISSEKKRWERIFQQTDRNLFWKLYELSDFSKVIQASAVSGAAQTSNFFRCMIGYNEWRDTSSQNAGTQAKQELCNNLLSNLASIAIHIASWQYEGTCRRMYNLTVSSFLPNFTSMLSLPIIGALVNKLPRAEVPTFMEVLNSMIWDQAINYVFGQLHNKINKLYHEDATQSKMLHTAANTLKLALHFGLFGIGKQAANAFFAKGLTEAKDFALRKLTPLALGGFINSLFGLEIWDKSIHFECKTKDNASAIIKLAILGGAVMGGKFIISSSMQFKSHINLPQQIVELTNKIEQDGNGAELLEYKQQLVLYIKELIELMPEKKDELIQYAQSVLGDISGMLTQADDLINEAGKRIYGSNLYNSLKGKYENKDSSYKARYEYLNSLIVARSTLLAREEQEVARLEAIVAALELLSQQPGVQHHKPGAHNAGLLARAESSLAAWGAQQVFKYSHLYTPLANRMNSKKKHCGSQDGEFGAPKKLSI